MVPLDGVKTIHLPTTLIYLSVNKIFRTIICRKPITMTETHTFFVNIKSSKSDFSCTAAAPSRPFLRYSFLPFFLTFLQHHIDQHTILFASPSLSLYYQFIPIRFPLCDTLLLFILLNTFHIV